MPSIGGLEKLSKKKEKRRNKRNRQKRRRAAGQSTFNKTSSLSRLPTDSSPSASSMSSYSEKEVVGGQERPVHRLTEILEQEHKDTEERARWYEHVIIVMSSPDESKDIKELCIELTV